jgi:hypothetical protein
MTNEQMSSKYIAAGLIGIAAIVGWNIFLIQRDAKLFEAYNHSIHQVK